MHTAIVLYFLTSQDIQNFCSYSHWMWSTLLEIVISSCMLYFVLGKAAVGGMVVMVSSLALGLMISKM